MQGCSNCVTLVLSPIRPMFWFHGLLVIRIVEVQGLTSNWFLYLVSVLTADQKCSDNEMKNVSDANAGFVAFVAFFLRFIVDLVWLFGFLLQLLSCFCSDSDSDVCDRDYIFAEESLGAENVIYYENFLRYSLLCCTV